MRGFTLWITGLPGSGKSTLAQEVEGTLLERGIKAELLDGADLRESLCQDLGFSKEDRDTNIRRIAWVANILARNEVVAIAAAITPYKELRDENRQIIGRYVEVHCKCDLEVLKQRDTKGLYARAISGELENFTGISAPYEEPVDPEVICETDKETEEESVAKIIHTLELMGFIEPLEGSTDYSAEEEDEIHKRLAALGYI